VNVYSSSRIRIGPPLLLVKDIDRELRFYGEYFNLQPIRKYQDHREDRGFIYDLGFRHLSGSSEGLPLISLQHNPDPKVPSPRSAGLYHFAILVPDRSDLAATYLALKGSGIRFDGFADHLVSESLYLHDPENNGIEIYRDRPSEEWPRDAEGRLVMDTLPLNLQSLLSETNNVESHNRIPFPNGGVIGHIHLRVTNLERSIRFYHEKLGLDMTTTDWISMGIAFLSEGGYHHHVAINTLYSLNGDVHRDGVTGLKNFTIIASDSSFYNSIKSNIIMNNRTSENKMVHNGAIDKFTIMDPDGIQIILRTK
jgi:catechol 2,3-dioxygenase